MYIPKRYGESRIESCPFCGKQALIKNPQGIATCKDHKDKKLPEMKCVCGEYLLMQEGKFGVFFNCFKCGNINLKKALEINHNRIFSDSVDKPNIQKSRANYTSIPTTRNNINKNQPVQTVRSDDPRYFGY